MWKFGKLSYSKIFLSLLIFSAVFLLYPKNEVQANASHNIRGWAYNSSYGYISMNCLDDNFAGRFTFTFPFTFFITPCSLSQHGVHLDVNNNFSGQAWNSILGFIDFNGATAPDYLFEASCQSACNAGNNCTACYNENTEKVYGWARVVNTGDWIKLNDVATSPTVGITNYNAGTPGIFSGYASSTISGIGQAISFNCTNDGSCGTNPYAVRIGPLEVRQLIAPNWTPQQVCDSRITNKAVMSWNRRSGTQGAYQIIVNNVNSTSTPFYNSGKIMSSANQAIVTGLNLNQAYYWFVQLWDTAGSSTPWYQFDTNKAGIVKDVLTDNNFRNGQIGNSKTFATYKHNFPLPSFTYPAGEIAIGTSTPFNGIISSYYNDGQELKPCSGGICVYKWSVIGDDRAVINSTTTASTTIIFGRATSTTVKLELTDDAPYTCSTSTVLSVNYALPLWKEIKPTK
jgi:hypothetical protein